MLFRQANLSFIIILILVFTVFAKEDVKIQDFKLNSLLMTREIPYRVIFPPKYKQKDKKKVYPVIYLLHGLTGHFFNWTDKTKIAEYARNYNFIIVLVEGNDGWYSDSATVPIDRYESYLIRELIPEIDKNFRTDSRRTSRFIAGLSMGGYGAIKFGLKYPDKFALVGSFSGAFDAPIRGEKNNFLRPSVLSVFGELHSQTRKDNDIFKIISELSDPKIKELPFIYFACGTEDRFFQINRDFGDFLLKTKVPHEFRQLPGKHDWNFWNSQVAEFARLANKFREQK